MAPVTVRPVGRVVPPTVPLKVTAPEPALTVKVLAPLIVPPTEKFLLSVAEILVLLLNVT